MLGTVRSILCIFLTISPVLNGIYNFKNLKQPFIITKSVYVYGRNVRKYGSAKIRK